MAGFRCTDLQSRPMEFLACTSLPREALEGLVPPLEAAFHAPRAVWRLAGTPRTARQCAVYQHGPLPTAAARRFFLRTYRKPYARQVVHGRLVGMGQSQAQQWRHLLWPALLAALRTRGAAPARSLTALAQRRGGSAAAAATGGVLLEEAPAPVAAEPAATPASPLVPMLGRNGASSAPKPLVNRPRVRAARTRPIRSKLCCWSRPSACSSFCVTPLAAVSMTSGLPTRRPRPYPPGAGCDRLWASWRSHSLGGRSSGPPRNLAARS
jgi:hypothetical protein